MKCLMYFMVFLYLSSFAKGQFNEFLDTDPDTLTDDNTVIEKWAIMESRIKYLSEGIMNAIYPALTEMMVSLNISKSCFRDCTKLFLGLRKLNTWAVKFLDASTKSADGILNFQMPSLGSYEECVGNVVYFRRRDEKESKVMFQGKFCNINIRPYLSRHEIPNLIPGSATDGISRTAYPEESIFSELAKIAPLTYHAPAKAALCVPSGCSTEDVNAMLRKVSDYIGLSVKAKRCAIEEEKEYTPVRVAIMTIYCMTGFLVLLGTTIDIYCYYSKKGFENTGIQILKSFSFVSNFKKLTDTSSSSKTGCLNAIRVLSMIWVLLVHTFMLAPATTHGFTKNYEDYLGRFAFQVIMNANLSVDTFFFLSGFLVCYTTIKFVKIKKNSFTVTLYVVHRLWRIIPAYAFVIGFEFIKPLTGSGPLFHDILGHTTRYCEKNWWTNLLFINNFFGQSEMCLVHTWYIAVDTQLYIFALVILLPLLKWPKIGLCIAGVIIAGCTAAAAVTSYTHNMLAILFVGESSEELSYFHQYHNMNPYLHAPAFCIGLLLGYLLAIRSDFEVSKALQMLGWSASVATCLAVVYGAPKWNAVMLPSVFEKTIYSALSRPAWTLGVAWMTFCCCIGSGGVINYILSWKMWVPLSRLTYFAYLVHIPVIVSYAANTTIVHPYKNYHVVWMFFGHLFVTYAVAFVGSMVIEMPFLSLEKVLLFRSRKKEDLSSARELQLKENDLENKAAVNSQHVEGKRL